MSAGIEFEDGKPPEWMIALENKQKRQHKLAHDIGAGAPCLNCNLGCAGLALHFWRKICRNCKCKKEDHDVKEEDNFEQFEILFGDDFKGSDRVKKLSLSLKFKIGNALGTADAQNKTPASGKSDNDLLFDWIPTDVPTNLASEYLQQLPLEKLPITNSAGAMFRRQQLQKQIPLHDFKIKNDLTDEETKAFAEYIKDLKMNAVGKGQITKILPHNIAADNENGNAFLRLPALSNNLNSSPKPFISYSGEKVDDSSLPHPPAELLAESGLHLKTPSAFIPYKQSSGISKRNINEIAGVPVPYNTQNMNYDKFKENSAHVNELSAQYARQLDISDKFADTENNNIPSESENGNDSSADNLTPSEIIKKFNSRGNKPSRTINGVGEGKHMVVINPKTYCDKSSPYFSKEAVQPLDQNSTTLKDNYNGNADVIKNIDGRFVKLGNPEQFEALSSLVPNTPLVSNTLASSGTKNLSNAGAFNPSSTNSEKQSGDKQLTEKSVDVYSAEANENIFCHQCNLAIRKGEVVVLAERAGIEVMWHPQCFVCVACQELLVDLVYFFHKNKVYCGRHYAEVLQIPRCFACDELIFLKEYTMAEGQSFHVKHFCCFECDIPLAGLQYVPKDNNPVCLSCYEIKYGKKCHNCKNMIKAGDSRIGWKDLSWHESSNCFKCSVCSKSLLGNKFIVKNDNPLCSKECMLKQQIKVN